MKTLKNKKCGVDVRTKIMNPINLQDLLHGVDFTVCKQSKQCFMLKCQSNIASKPVTGMQRYTISKKKHLTSLKVVRVEVVGALGDLSNLKIIGHALPAKCYLTEPVELCQRDVTLTQ